MRDFDFQNFLLTFLLAYGMSPEHFPDMQDVYDVAMANQWFPFAWEQTDPELRLGWWDTLAKAMYERRGPGCWE